MNRYILLACILFCLYACKDPFPPEDLQILNEVFEYSYRMSLSKNESGFEALKVFRCLECHRELMLKYAKKYELFSRESKKVFDKITQIIHRLKSAKNLYDKTIVRQIFIKERQDSILHADVVAIVDKMNQEYEKHKDTTIAYPFKRSLAVYKKNDNDLINFETAKAIEAITYLNFLKNELINYETNVLEVIIGELAYYFEGYKIKPYIYANPKNVLLHSNYEAEIFIPLYNDMSIKSIQVNNDVVDFNYDGVAVWRIMPNQIGKHTWNARILANQDGKDTLFQLKGAFEVIPENKNQ